MSDARAARSPPNAGYVGGPTMAMIALHCIPLRSRGRSNNAAATTACALSVDSRGAAVTAAAGGARPASSRSRHAQPSLWFWLQR